MATEILMPALSPTMEEGTLAKWLVKEGDTVKSGDIMAEIETDKATMEFEAVDEGVIGKILIEEGTEGVKVNTAIAILVEEGEEVGDVETAKPAETEEAPAKEEAKGDSPAGGKDHPAPAKPETADGARGIARRHGRRNAPRRKRVPDGRGSGRVSGRLQDFPRAAG